MRQNCEKDGCYISSQWNITHVKNVRVYFNRFIKDEEELTSKKSVTQSARRMLVSFVEDA